MKAAISDFAFGASILFESIRYGFIWFLFRFLFSFIFLCFFIFVILIFE